MTTSEISGKQRRGIARALGNYAYSLLEEVQHGEHPEQENDRLRAMAADCSHLAVALQGKWGPDWSMRVEDLDPVDLELIEAAIDGHCWKLRQKGTVSSVLEASSIESAAATIAEQVA